MRLLRTLAAFVVGFVFGVLCLGIGLWYMGSLNVRYLVAHWRHPSQQQQAQQMPAPGSPLDVNQLIASAGKPPTPIGQNPVEPPPVLEPPKGATGATGMIGEANREMTPPPAIAGPKTVPPATAGAKTTPAAAPPPQHLAMPISGVDPKKLSDDFDEMRDGHKHEALDIAAPKGTPVHAVAPGNVVKLFTSKAGGLTIYQFDNDRKYCFYYAHLDRYAPGLQENTSVKTGDIIGYVGTTGDAPPNAPHLHFAMNQLGPDQKWWKGTPIDPLPLLK